MVRILSMTELNIQVIRTVLFTLALFIKAIGLTIMALITVRTVAMFLALAALMHLLAQQAKPETPQPARVVFRPKAMALPVV